jgi:Fungal Zn(2)-Cys(6) binuclear cluster domain
VAIASSIDANVETKGKNEDHQQNEGHQRTRGQALFKIHKQSAADAFYNSINATEAGPVAPALNTSRYVETEGKNHGRHESGLDNSLKLLAKRGQDPQTKCRECFLQKQKCDGGRPCSSCIRYKNECRDQVFEKADPTGNELMVHSAE